MQRLDYRLPQIIADKLGPLEGHIIDLGCGTGLTGVALKNPRNSLTGIDISPAMLEKAREKRYTIVWKRPTLPTIAGVFPWPIW